MGVWGCLHGPWRNDPESYLHDGQATRLQRAVPVVEMCMSCLVSRSISNLRVVYALARRQQLRRKVVRLYKGGLYIRKKERKNIYIEYI